MSLLGIDVGTSGVKVILLGEKGEIVANLTEEYPSFSPRPQWSEQHPEDWWQATCRAVHKALSQSGFKPSEVSGIGLSGQMVGLVALDERGNVVRPCIMWNDQRSAVETEELTEQIGLQTVLRETSNPLFATFVAPKLVWMRHNERDKYEQIRHIFMPKDYIVYRLTGHIGTEVSDASGTCLLNVRERRWSRVMMQVMEIPAEWLPPCTESDEIAGRVTSQAAEESGLSEGTPVVAGAGDQPAQALGSGIVRPGLCSVTIGTSGVVFAQGDRHIEHPEGLLHSFCHSVHGKWYLMGVMLSAGGSFQWLRDLFESLAPISYEDMTEQAAGAPPGCEGLVFLPYLTGERCPYDDPYARGGFIGLTPRHDVPHLIRAVMEGITFGLCDSVRLMRDLGMEINRIFASGGAVRSALWRQMLADVFDTEIVSTNVAEGAAYGAAMLAGIGTRQYADAIEAAEDLIRATDIAEPNPDIRKIYEDTYGTYRSLYPKLRGSFRILTKLATTPGGNGSEMGTNTWEPGLNTMTSRERVRAAISHLAPNRVPIDLNITLTAYEKLKGYLGLDIDDATAPNAAMEVIPHPEVLMRLGVDLISVKLGGVKQLGAALPEVITDAWGIKRKLVRQTVGEYYEVVSHPLAGMSIDDLKDFPWPESRPLEKAELLRKNAEGLYRNTDLALVGRFGGPVLELAADLLGMEEWYIRLVTDQGFVADLLDRISQICTAHDLLGLEAAGEFLEIAKVSGEDFGIQRGPLYSPDVFHNILLPPLKKRWSAAHEKLAQVNPRAKIMLHSCGAVRDFIPDLIASGIDILDPVQPLAQGMDPEGLYTAFSGDLVFHGGIDIQQLLPYGSPEEVAVETQRCMAGFRAAGGGFIVAPSHTVQADVPPQNILAMVDAVKNWNGKDSQ